MSDLIISKSKRKLGTSGMDIFPISYGMWRFAGTSVDQARAKIDAALEEEITLFDTADIYGFGEEGFGAAEELYGQILAQSPQLRDQMIITTKGGITPPVPYDSTQSYLVKACENSLKRLNIDYIDLYQIHRPDVLAHPEEVAQALNKLVTEGKVRHVGVSNYTTAQFSALSRYMEKPLVSHQPELSVLAPEPITNGLLDQCMEYKVCPLAWSPLGGGRLFSDNSDSVQRVVEALDVVASEQGAALDAVAYAWLLAHPAGVIPIIGTQNIDRIKQTKNIFNVRITRSQWYDVLEAAVGYPMP
jgi:predicted oxidoreductase